MAVRIPDRFKGIDWWLVGASGALFLFGLVALYSLAEYGAIAFSIFWKQAAYGLLGIAIALAFASVNMQLFKKHGGLILGLYAGMLVLLLGLLVFGEVVRGTRAWYRIGSFSIAPVEFAKIVFLLLLAKFFSDRHRDLYTVRHILVSLAYLGAMAGLVLLQPDAGSALTLIALWGGLLLFTGIRFRWVVTLFVAALIILAMAWQWGLQDYQKERVKLLMNPSRDAQGIGYNVIQAKAAIGSGGLFGKGFGQGTQGGRRFLPEASTDFIFAVVAEEQGLAGMVMVLGLFAVVWYRVVKIGSAATHNFARIFAFGYAWLIAIHFFVNVGMNTGLFPVVGLPLPFVSYGGSHIISEFIGLGMVLAIALRETVRPTRHLVIE
ncbi:MAG: FtsW/RodA/SpoVE family cell cycle protein [bacterium]|nr:FtsW/RodA/SpoVE family cell cycle protein [bacterium]